MNFEKISASIKPRNGWQSIDLGIMMVRTWAKPLYGAWFLFTFPIFLLLNVLVVFEFYLPILVFWWLKPFFESMLLYYCSHALFGEQFSLKETIKNFPSQGRIQLLPYLTYRRFSPYRAFTLPVTQLEKLTGTPRKRRIRLLLDTVDTQALGLILFLVHVEFFLLLSFHMVIIALIPTNILDQFFGSYYNFQLSGNHWVWLLNNLLVYLSMSLVAPFYVGAGFSLYVNRRASLEGWDIELIFRRIANRFNQIKESKRHLEPRIKNMLSLMIAFALSTVVLLPANALAQQNDTQETRREPVVHTQTTSKQQITGIILGEDFHQKKTITRYKFLDDWLQEQKKEPNTIDISPEMKKVLLWLAKRIEVVLWLSFFAILLLFVYSYRHWFREITGLPKTPQKESVAPQSLFGLDIRETSLPENIPETVRKLWQEGHKRTALSLLYRSTLSQLVSRHACDFLASYTEQECLNLVLSKQLGELGNYCKTLTAQWQLLAYGHKLLETDLIEQLCKQWSEFFEHDDSANTAKQES